MLQLESKNFKKNTFPPVVGIGHFDKWPGRFCLLKLLEASCSPASIDQHYILEARETGEHVCFWNSVKSGTFLWHLCVTDVSPSISIFSEIAIHLDSNIF